MRIEADEDLIEETFARTEVEPLPDGGVRVRFFRPEGTEIGTKDFTSTEAELFQTALDEAIDKWRSLN